LDAPAYVRVRRASIDHIAVALELGPAEDEREASGGVAKAGGRRLPTVASASELEAAVRGEEEKEAYGASELAS
jgi:hypothetical protein